MTTKTTDLVPVGDYQLIAAGDTDDLLEIVDLNVGPSGITPFELDRIRIPAGGGLSWAVPTLEGEDSEKIVEGIVIHWREPRAYWATGIDESGGGSPPDCAADDGEHGTGEYGVGSKANPKGLCVDCPKSQWGSDPRSGRGQACKQIRLLFVLRPDDILPIAMPMPPTSIKPVRTYFLRLANARLPYYAVTTRFALERTRNAAGIDFARVALTKGVTLDDGQRAAVREYAQKIRPALDAVRVRLDDVETDDVSP